MNKDELKIKLLKATTFLELKRLVIDGFEEFEFEKTRNGIEKYEKLLKSLVPNIDQVIQRFNPIKGNGIIEILEDFLHLK